MRRAVAQKSDIEWTDATWNPVTGCTKVGPGCDNCYAERFAERWRGIPGHPYEQGFDLTLWPSRLKQPALWKKPRMIFVNSMSDLFHKDIDRAYIDQVFEVMERANWHVYLPRPRIEIPGPQGIQATFDWQAAKAVSPARMCTAVLVNTVVSY